jgi:hydrogenase-4 membrane subunit HyfE
MQKNWFDRMIDWILDRDGDIYGDERARLRWYEAIAVTASVQWILVLWVLAFAAWRAPTSASPYLWAIGAAFLFPLYLSIFYLSRRGVDVSRPSTSRKSRLLQAFTILPMIVYLVGLTVGHDLRSGRSWSELSPALRGAMVGGAIGLVIATLFLVVRRRTEQRRIDATEDLD